MGFRDRWLSNPGAVSRHFEVTLHAIDRDVPDRVTDMLLVGVENGGDVEVWPQVLPEGSTVTAIERESTVVTDCNPSDPQDLLATLGRRGFDVIMWRHEGVPEFVWPWLRPGGRLIVEDLWAPSGVSLATAVHTDVEAWLPVEEIMRVSVYPHVLVVEKRLPRVLPYLEIMTGNFADVVPEDELMRRGVKRVLVD